MRNALLAAPFVLTLVPIAPLRAQVCEPAWLPTFGPLAGFDGEGSRLLSADLGAGPALYAAGGFRHAGGVEADGIACWDGAAWSPLGDGIGHDRVAALAVFDGGGGPELYAGGRWVQGPNQGITRWDGAEWRLVGFAGVTGEVHALHVADLGSGPALYVTGEFPNAAAVVLNGIGRWNGTSWSALGTGLGGPAPVGTALAVHDDGGGAALYVGGTFASAGGTIADRIARWNGSSWTALTGGAPPGTTGAVVDLVSFDDGGGPALFALVESSNAVHRWRAGAWTSVGTTSGTPTSLAVADLGGGSVLYVAASLGSGTSATTAIGTWDGTTWQPAAAEASGVTRDLAAHDDGSGVRLVAAGTLTRGLDQPPVPTRWIDLDGVGAWDGTGWSSLGGGPSAVSDGVSRLAVADLGDGPVLFASGFRSVGGEAVDLVAGWDGARWSILPLSGFTPDLSAVRAMCAYDAGIGNGPALFVGGSFSGGTGSTNALLSWDGASWSAPGGGLLGTTWALATFDDGSGEALYASVSFPLVGAQPLPSVVRWDGTAWSGVGRGVEGRAFAFAVHDVGGGPELFATGSFARAGAVSANNVARWNGTRWASVGGGVDEPVQALAVYDDGNGARLYAGASNFELPGSAVLSFDGASWVPTGDLRGRVWALAAFDDGTGEALYAGGTLGLDNIMRWDGSSWTTLGGGVERYPLALTTYDDGSGEALFVGGGFDVVPDSGDAYLAKWGCAGSAGRSFCLGDAALCPCANAGSGGAGCADQQAAQGVRLGVLARTTGPDAATLRGTGFAAAGAPAALLLRSSGLAAGGPTAFGDGLLCLSATSLVRLSSATAGGGTALFTIGHGPQAGAGTFWYQLWFRSVPSTFCDPLAAFNLSSGARIDW